jgi:hypothetical protein
VAICASVCTAVCVLGAVRRVTNNKQQLKLVQRSSITFLHQLMRLYIYYQSLKHFVHLIAPTCFDTQRVIVRELYFPG